MSRVLTRTSLGAESTAAVTEAIYWLCCKKIAGSSALLFGITNKNILSHIQGLDWNSSLIICSNIFYYHRDFTRNFASVAEDIALHFNQSVITFSVLLTNNGILIFEKKPGNLEIKVPLHQR